MSDPNEKKENGQQLAQEYFQRAYAHQVKGELEEAIALYKRSIEILPTAEAHTFLGWTYSFQRLYEDAIQQCHLAIQVDPTFGNPYNDIGAYLIELGRWEEALPWFEKALKASRYENYFFAHLNSGRVHEHFHRWPEAAQCYQRALRENPQYLLAHQALRRLQARWN